MSEPKNTREIVALNLSRLMGRKNFSQAELARKSGVSQRLISGILNREISTTVDRLDQLASALGVNAWHLQLPNLSTDQQVTKELGKLCSWYMESRPRTRAFIYQIAEQEAEYKTGASEVFISPELNEEDGEQPLHKAG